jgi:hypothetical protein
LRIFAASCIYSSLLLFAGGLNAKQRLLVSADDADAYVSERQRCGETMSVRIVTSDSDYFVGQTVALQKLVAGAAAVLGFECGELETLEVRGIVNKDLYLLAEARKSEGWKTRERYNFAQIILDLEAFQPEAGNLSQLSKKVAKAKKLAGSERTPLPALLSKYRIAWAEDLQTAYLSWLASPSQSGTISGWQMLQERRASFTRAYSDLFGVGGLTDELNEIYESAESTWVYHYVDALSQSYVERLATENAWEHIETEDGYLPSSLPAPLRNNHRILAKLEERAAVVFRGLLNERLAELVVRNDFRQRLENIESSWDGLAELARLAGPFNGTDLESASDYRDMAKQAYEERLDFLVDTAQERLQMTSGRYEDIPGFIRASMAEIERFIALGNDRIAETLVASIRSQANEVAKSDFPAYRDRVDALPAVAASVDALLADAYAYREQTDLVPAFGQYSDYASSRVGPLREDVKADAIAAAALSETEAKTSVIGESLQVNIKDLVGEAALNGWQLVQLEFVRPDGRAIQSGPFAKVGWVLGPRQLKALQFRQNGESVQTLHLGPHESGTGKMTLLATEQEGQKTFIKKEERDAALRAYIAPPVTGFPDEKGVFDVDRLASDPDDPRRVAPGVSIEALDFERAVEAASKAYEVASENARVNYLFGRLLFLAGQMDTAEALLQLAHEKGYGSASLLLAEMRMSGLEEAGPRERVRLLEEGELYVVEAAKKGHPKAEEVRKQVGEILEMMRPVFSKQHFHEPEIMEAFFTRDFSLMKGINPAYVKDYIRVMNKELNSFQDLRQDNEMNRMIQEHVFGDTSDLNSAAASSLGNAMSILTEMMADPNKFIKEGVEAERNTEGARRDIMKMLQYLSMDEVPLLREEWKRFYRDPSSIMTERTLALQKSCREAYDYLRRLNRDYYLSDLGKDEIDPYCECVITTVRQYINEDEEDALIKNFVYLNRLLSKNQTLKMILSRCMR